MLSSMRCTAYFPTVTSSTLVRSELMRFMVPPQRWMRLRTGECVGRGIIFHYVCLNYVYDSQKIQWPQLTKDTVTRTNPNVWDAKLLSLLPSPENPRSALSCYTELSNGAPPCSWFPPAQSLHQTLCFFSIPAEPWLSWRKLLGWLDKPIPAKLLANTLPLLGYRF